MSDDSDTDNLGIGTSIVVVTIIILSLVDTLIIMLCWNHFLAKVSGLPHVSFIESFYAFLLKTSFTRGFAFRTRNGQA